MKLIRLCTAIAVGLSLALVGPAVAAAKVPCKLITDAPGDAYPINSAHIHDTIQTEVPVNVPAFPPVTQGPSSDVLDVLSADLATDKRTITAVIRVKKLAITAPSAAPTGISWFMNFSADGADFKFAAHTDPTGAQYFDASYSAATGGSLYGGGVTGKLDLAKNEVRISAPVSLLANQATIKRGVKITKISAGAANEVAVFDKTARLTDGGIFEWAIINADRAVTSKSYIAETKTCVTPGK